MLTKLKDFVKIHFNDILIFMAIILISLFSFAMGYIISNYQEKELIKIESME